jgi:hypothetical protein
MDWGFRIKVVFPHKAHYENDQPILEQQFGMMNTQVQQNTQASALGYLTKSTVFWLSNH